MRSCFPALLAVLLAPPLIAAAQEGPAREVDESVSVPQLSCTAGPYRPRLPVSYRALRKLAKLKREKLHDAEDSGGHKTEHRSLRFVGLELFIITKSNKPDQYILSAAILTTPAWRFGGQLRVGAPAHAALKGLPLKRISPDAEIELNGDADSIRITFAGGRVQEVEYDCHTE